MNPYEIVTLAVGLVVVFLLLAHRRRFLSLPNLVLLLAAVLSLVVSHLFSSLEELFEINLLHLAEHLMATVSAVLLALWSWVSFHGGVNRE